MKTEDIEYPNLMIKGVKEIRNKEMLFIGLLLSMILIIVGIVTIILLEIFSLTIPSITCGILLLIIIPSIYFSSPTKKTYEKIQNHTMKRNIAELIALPRKSFNTTKIVIYALIDLKEFDEAEKLVNDLEKSLSNFRKNFVRSNMRTYMQIIRDANRQTEIDNLSIESENTISEREIKKVFFFDNMPKDAKCMISSIKLDIENHSILACPFCEGMAKEDLFKKWLEENNKCPVCKRELVEDDLVLVKLK